MLRALIELNARMQGKPRWVEKTPNHLLHVAQVRSAFSDARILRVVRNPRDVAHSMRQLPWGSRSAIANGLLWADWHARSEHEFAPKHADVLTVRYEDLMSSPESTLTTICDFDGAHRKSPVMLVEFPHLCGSAESGGSPSKLAVSDHSPAARRGPACSCSHGEKTWNYRHYAPGGGRSRRSPVTPGETGRRSAGI
ncbi:sulfotransferase [uncultured Jatrophihabitans sp.]|uniref:sulfotransferase family protein n=1 Tax=uncultured Jatrophihabitans sp. TaxID=1610747 RepID=UPI0035CC7057